MKIYLLNKFDHELHSMQNVNLGEQLEHCSDRTGFRLNKFSQLTQREVFAFSGVIFESFPRKKKFYSAALRTLRNIEYNLASAYAMSCLSGREPLTKTGVGRVFDSRQTECYDAYFSVREALLAKETRSQKPQP